MKAVRSASTVFQIGSQQRSDAKFRLACELVRNGRIGKLQHIIVGLPDRAARGPVQPGPGAGRIGLGLSGWARRRCVDYNGHNCHWNFRWWYYFSGGR